jgi:hypothetical protein
MELTHTPNQLQIMRLTRVNHVKNHRVLTQRLLQLQNYHSINTFTVELDYETMYH